MAQVDDEDVATALEDLFTPDEVEAHPVVARMAAELWVRRSRAMADIERRGLVVNGKPHPILNYLSAWEGRLLALFREFGLTPMAEAQLAHTRAEALSTAFDLDAIRTRGREIRQAAGQLVEAEPVEAACAGDGQP